MIILQHKKIKFDIANNTHICDYFDDDSKQC